jgi:hypothetical protein
MSSVNNSRSFPGQTMMQTENEEGAFSLLGTLEEGKRKDERLIID